MLRFVIFFLTAALLWGCASTEPEPAPEQHQPEWQHIDFKAIMRNEVMTTEEKKAISWDKQMDFFADLEDKPIASMADAVTAMMLHRGISPWDRDLEELADQLAAEGIISEDWTVNESEPLTTGKISFMVYQACDMRGGLWLHLFGPTERYCYKEAVYQEVVRPGSLHRYVSGIALLDIVSQCSVYEDLQSGEL